MQVPSLSFARNKAHFFKHDETGMTTFLEAVKSNEMTISGALLPPYKLVYEAIATSRALDSYPIGTLEGLSKQSKVDPEVTKEDLKLLRGFERKWIPGSSRRSQSSGERHRVRCTLPISEALMQFNVFGHYIGHLQANTISLIYPKQGARLQSRRSATRLLPSSLNV